MVWQVLIFGMITWAFAWQAKPRPKTNNDVDNNNNNSNNDSSNKKSRDNVLKIKIQMDLNRSQTLDTKGKFRSSMQQIIQYYACGSNQTLK